jgi:hypothetical protein
VIAAGISFAAGAVSAWWVTADYKEAKYTAVIAKMKLDSADALAKAQQKAIEVERENNRLAQEIEVNNAKFKQELADLESDLRRRIDDAGGLYDRNAAPSNCSVPSNTQSATKPATPPANTKLSAELTRLLLSEAKRADDAAAYAKTCYEWVKKLEGQR